MIPIALPTLEAIGRGEYANTLLLLFDLPEGQFGFWPGIGTLNVGGFDYVGAGSLLTIEQIQTGVDISASPLNVTLRAVPVVTPEGDTPLSPDVLATIDNYAYKNRPARLSYAWFNPATGALVTVVLWWQGYIDTIEHNEVVGGDYALVARLEPVSLDHSRIGYRMRSDTDQKLIDPTDKFFEHAAVTGTEEIKYGASDVAAETQQQSQASVGGWVKRTPGG